MRLHYPIVDPASGMNVLNGLEFQAEKIMPICLPQSEMFQDTERQATAVGMGITAEKSG